MVIGDDNTASAKFKTSRSWDNLSPPLSAWLRNAMGSLGYARMTPVQANTIPLFLGYKDVVVEAVTGSGKTLAFLIPAIERVLRLDEPIKRHHVGVIIISPTRELASQIYSVLCSVLAFHEPSASANRLPVDSEDVVSDQDAPEVKHDAEKHIRNVVPQLLQGGNVSIADDLKNFLRVSPNLLIATPGRLLELLCSPHVHCPQSSFELLILDEADRLLDLGFKTDLQKILARLPKQRRTGLFSASVSEAVDQLVRVGLRNPVRVTVKVKSTSGEADKRTPASLDLRYLITPSARKISILVSLLAKVLPLPGKVIVFFATCATVDYFQSILPSLIETHDVVSLHGKHPPNARLKNFTRFVENVRPVCMLTTDVAARGLDIPTVDLVVQFDPPSDPKTFLHRAGRAGRAGRRGLAITFLRPGCEEDYVRFLAVRDTPIVPLSSPELSITDKDASSATNKIRQTVLADRALYEKAQRAFVSWVRAYKSHVAASIFQLSDLKWDELASDWGLLRLPRMPEAKNWEGDRLLGLRIDWDNYEFRDKAREKKRKADLETLEQNNNIDSRSKGVQYYSKKKSSLEKENAWSQNKQRLTIREERRKKRHAKQDRIKHGKMTLGEKLKEVELQEMIQKVRKQTVANEDEFQGFDD